MRTAEKTSRLDPQGAVCMSALVWLTSTTPSCLRRGTGLGPRSQEVGEEGDYT